MNPYPHPGGYIPVPAAGLPDPWHALYNADADSRDVLYDGMYCNATNQDPTFIRQK